MRIQNNPRLFKEVKKRGVYNYALGPICLIIFALYFSNIYKHIILLCMADHNRRTITTGLRIILCALDNT